MHKLPRIFILLGLLFLIPAIGFSGSIPTSCSGDATAGDGILGIADASILDQHSQNDLKSTIVLTSYPVNE